MEKFELLLQLALKGAIGERVRITMRELARDLNTSPQTILRKLEELERLGYLKRSMEGKKTYVELSEEGITYLSAVYEKLGDVFYKGKKIIGEVVSGIGEGAYYIRYYEPLIEEYLNFRAYPGTLNVKVIFPKTVFDALCDVEPIIIPGFKKEGRTFGDVKAYRVRIDGIEGAIVIPFRTIHPPEITEIIAPVNLRKKLNLKDGDRIRIEVLG